MTQTDLQNILCNGAFASIWRTRVLALVIALTALVGFQFIQVTAAKAAVTEAEELATFGSLGSGAGELDGNRGIAADPRTGYLYAFDEANDRISEFTPWGTFVKAFGWDVAPGAVNEQQEVRIQGSEGQFRLHFGAEETTDLELGATDTEVQAALTALAGVGAGNASVRAVLGNAEGSTPFIYIITFRNGKAATNEPQIGVSASVTLTTITRTIASGTAGGTELESCTEESACRAGQRGAGAGEFAPFAGLAVDADGDIFAREIINNRVQVFDPSGEFLRMFGEGVNKTTGTDICTQEDIEVDHDVCGAGETSGAADSFSSVYGIVIGPDGKVYLPDEERIQVFDEDGTFDRTIPVPGRTLNGIALNSVNDGFYVTFAGEPNVGVLAPSGTLERSCPVPRVGPGGFIASDASANLYVVEESTNNPLEWIRAFDPSCQPEGKFAETTRDQGFFFSLTGLAVNGAGDLYAGNYLPSVGQFIRSFGPAPVKFESPPVAAPTIVGQFPVSVRSDSATIGTFVNPHFWTDTHVYVEYGTGSCSSGACNLVAPAPPGALLTSEAKNTPVRSPGLSLDSLQPNTTYHFRIVAESTGGGPVRGAGGTVGSDGTEGTFRTFPSGVSAQTACPNQSLRTGPSAFLPDCRAYEMVSPIDKDNGDIKSLVNAPGFFTDLTRSSLDGNKVAYSSYRSFGNPAGAPYTNQYIATRNSATGWESEAISAPIGANGVRGIPLEAQHKAFNGDLCDSWLLAASEPVLAAGAGTVGFNPYHRSYCGGETYESLIHVEPPAVDEGFEVEMQGYSEDGRTVVFRGPFRLTADANPGVQQAYISSPGKSQQFICILPNGQAWTSSCSAGSAPSSSNFPFDFQDRYGSVTHALSTDGRRLYWTASTPAGSEDEATVQAGAGKVFMRENPAEPQSAVTIPVSEAASTKAARFLAADPDGSRAIFVVTEGAQEGSLYRFQVGEGAALIARKTLGVAGQSEDLSTVYFISEEKLNGKGTPGAPNLYQWLEGTVTFISTLSSVDAIHNGQIGSDANVAPAFHAAQASSDGTTLAFISTANLTGYDNTDAASPLPCGTKVGATEGACDSEVYVFESGGVGPVCVSCNPTGALPNGRIVRGVRTSSRRLPTAASIPAPHYQLQWQRVLSADGKRLLFDSYDGLVPRDTNGAEDVYEWEAASSASACAELGAELYVETAAGCLSLISTGESAQDSEFLEASPSGDDVFFSTAQSLLQQDQGAVDIYDARHFGGLPPSPPGPEPCEGESCQPTVRPPAGNSAGSNVVGPGNPHKPCRKGTHRVKKNHKTRCVKNKARRQGHSGRHKKGHSGHHEATHRARAER